MRVSNKSMLYVSIIFLISSCATNNSLRKPVFETTTYKGQTGEKEVTNSNKNRADREKALFQAMEKADAAQRIVEQQKAEMEEACQPQHSCHKKEKTKCKNASAGSASISDGHRFTIDLVAIDLCSFQGLMTYSSSGRLSPSRG